MFCFQHLKDTECACVRVCERMSEGERMGPCECTTFMHTLYVVARTRAYIMLHTPRMRT